MTFEERLDFLFKSIESHDAQIGKLVEQQGTTDLTLQKLADLVNRLGTKVDKIADTLREVLIAVLNHEKRLGKLDGGETT